MEYDAATGKLKLKEGATAPTKSIYDKIKGSNKEGYYTSAEKLAAAGSNKEAGYYALPFENSLSGFIYDRDLFESSSWFKKQGRQLQISRHRQSARYYGRIFRNAR